MADIGRWRRRRDRSRVHKRKKDLHREKEIIREDENSIVDFLDANAAMKDSE